MDKSIMKYICKSCSGEYETVCMDGLYYYHACAPVYSKDGTYTERADKRDENVGTNDDEKGRDVVIE